MVVIGRIAAASADVNYESIVQGRETYVLLKSTRPGRGGGSGSHVIDSFLVTRTSRSAATRAASGPLHDLHPLLRSSITRVSTLSATPVALGGIYAMRAMESSTGGPCGNKAT